MCSYARSAFQLESRNPYSPYRVNGVSVFPASCSGPGIPAGIRSTALIPIPGLSPLLFPSGYR